MKKASEDENDINDVYAWVEVLIDLMHHVPSEIRANVFGFAASKMEDERKKLEANDGFIVWSVEDLLNAPGGFSTWNTEMRLKSLLVQIFVRDITNNHSFDDASKILFAHHRYGNGSGDLLDYIADHVKSQIAKERRQSKKKPPAEAGGEDCDVELNR